MPTTIVNDTFTGTDGTLLQSHVGEVGATWAKNPAATADAHLAGNQLAATGDAVNAVYVASGAPGGATSVSATANADVTAGGAIYLALDAQAGAETFYLGGYNNHGATPEWEIYKFVSGAATLAASGAASVPAAGAAFSFARTTSGGSKALAFSVGGVTLGSYTDTGTPLADGSPGVWMSPAGGVSVSLDNFQATTTGGPALTIGGVSWSQASGQITLALSAPLSGGAGSGYAYHVYRDGADPHFTPGSGNLLATVSSFPYTDASPLSGDNFYKVVGVDGGGGSVNAVPAGLTGESAAAPLVIVAGIPDASTPATTPPAADALIVVGIGDSITYGYTLADPATQSSFAQAAARLQGKTGITAVYARNEGHSGHTAQDWLPAGSDYSMMKADTDALVSAHAGARLVFSICLGTNDSAIDAAYSAYQANLGSIVDQLFADYPGLAGVVLHHPPYYSPNARTGMNYDEIGLSRLHSLFAEIDAVVSAKAAAHGGRVYRGDTHAWLWAAQNYQTALTAESGSDGTYYLHPDQAGAVTLGGYWGDAVYAALYATAPALTAGTLSAPTGQTSSSLTGIAWTGASGGTGTVTAQLQISAHGANTWSNVAGATASPASATGLAAATQYDLRVVWTDSATPTPETATSNVISGTTAAAAGAPTLCTVTLRIANPGSGGQSATLTTVNLPACTDAGFVAAQTFTATADISGNIAFENIPCGASVRVVVDALGLDHVYAVPVATTFAITSA